MITPCRCCPRSDCRRAGKAPPMRLKRSPAAEGDAIQVRQRGRTVDVGAYEVSPNPYRPWRAGPDDVHAKAGVATDEIGLRVKRAADPVALMVQPAMMVTPSRWLGSAMVPLKSVPIRQRSTAQLSARMVIPEPPNRLITRSRTVPAAASQHQATGGRLVLRGRSIRSAVALRSLAALCRR